MNEAKVIPIEYGKLQPQSVDLEEAVLGACMMDKEAIMDVADFLKPTDFYNERNEMVYEAILSLFSGNERVDILTVANRLKAKGNLEAAGGPLYIAQLTNRVASTANAEYHARIIKQNSVRRGLIRECSQIIKSSYDDTCDVFDLMERAERGLGSLTESISTSQVVHISDVVKQMEQEFFDSKKVSGPAGVCSGLTKLDRLTNGFQKTDLILIAARPGQGKTALALNIATNAAKQGIPVGFFTLEMSRKPLVKRIVASESEVPFELIYKNLLDEKDYANKVSMYNRTVERLPIHFVDKGGINLMELRARCRRLKVEKKIELIVVDYLQLVKSGENKQIREQEISMVSGALKEIAKELDVPVIALSQLSRAVETRGGDKKPMLSDLRESGALEQDADVIMFLMRPEYYGMTSDADGNSTKDVCWLGVLKHRNGRTDEFFVTSKMEILKFMDLQESKTSVSENNWASMRGDRELPKGDRDLDTPF